MVVWGWANNNLKLGPSAKVSDQKVVASIAGDRLFIRRKKKTSVM